MIPQDLFALNDPCNMSVDRKQISGRWLVVVDGVYKNPEAIRHFALNQNYGPGGGHYPGRFALVPLVPDPLLDLANKVVPSLDGRPLAIFPHYQGKIAFAIATAKGSDLTPLQQQPHSDEFCEYASVLYLSRPEDCLGGTSFWRHRWSGLEYAPTEGDPRTLELIERYEAGTPIQLYRRMLREAWAKPTGGYITESNGTWERIELVEMRQNRLVLYNANLFHSMHLAQSDWVPDLERPRLSQNLYLNWATYPHEPKEPVAY